MALRKIGSWTFGPAVATAYRDAENDEYQVKLTVNGVKFPDATYFCGSRDDAMGTANSMARYAAAKERDNAMALAASL